MNIKPVIKWVGGKRKIMDKVVNNIPDKFNNYYEPFLGGASVFLNIPYKNSAIISDYNKDLIMLYKNIKNNPNDLMLKLNKLQNKYNGLNGIHNKKEYFVNILKKINRLTEYTIERSALYIFINKTCFNGIMSTNKSGLLNPSFGAHEKINLYDKDNILNFSKLLKKSVKILNEDYKVIIMQAKKGDFVYLDPPYVPDDITNCNYKYVGKEAWKIKDFEELFQLYDELDKKGVYVMMSNSYSKMIKKHFNKSKYNILKVPIIRTISVDKNTRGKKYEVIITNYKNTHTKTRKKFGKKSNNNKTIKRR